MTSGSNEQLEEQLFELARKVPTEAARAAFLDRMCQGNPALRRSLDELLAAHFGQQRFLPMTADAHSSSPPSAPLDPPPQIIGRYRLLEKLGEGGFGEVWLAQQQEPIRRRVAVKIIKPGMDSKQVVARFEAERQALAMMDHPNIAKIFDGGVIGYDSSELSPPLITDQPQLPKGRPYFVMEWVQGGRITDYCEKAQLATVDRIQLFILVCNAVQHAHQKGIIHRDLKPSNILVTQQDGPAAAGCPKVIDFGIAKAIQQELNDETFHTQLGQFIGTPSYISPEQAEPGAEDIDTRSDIYSLGVLLYELLVGQTPFDAKEMTKGGLDALRKIIREQEPPRPSTKLRQLLTRAEVRAIEPPNKAKEQKESLRRLAQAKETLPLLHGDLDWIVLKCLEKDRRRRYATANGLAADLQRYLANEPIIARPPSTTYQLRKAWQRNKVVTVAAAVVALALAAGAGVSLWQAEEARQSRDMAQAALQKEASERRRAEASEQVAQGLLYVANMNLIRQAWEVNNLRRIRELLNETAGSPNRGFEWYYWQRQVHLDQRTLRGHASRVWSASFSPDGNRVVTASDDGTAKVWEAATGQELLTLPGHNDWVRSAAFSPDGKRIVTGSKDYIARVWDAVRGVEILRLLGHRAAIRTVDFFPDGRRIVTASQDGTARIWDVETGQQMRVLRGHSNWVFSAACSPDGRRIVTAGDDHSARIWDADDGRQLLLLDGHKGAIRMAAFSPDSRRVVTAVEDQTAKVWDAESGQLQQTLRGHRGFMFSASFSPDGRRIVTASGDQTIRVWDAESGRELNQLKGHGSEIYTAVFSKDGRQILTASEDGTAKIWDADSLPAPLPLAHGGSVLAVAISPDSQRIATGGSIGTTKIWSATSGELVLTLPNDGSKVQSIAFSPEGQRVATGHGDGIVRVWLAANGRRLFNFPGHFGVNSIAFSADGKKIVTAGSEGKVKVWNVEDGHELLSLPPVNGQTFSARFSPDSSRIVSASITGAKVWDAQTGAEIFPLIDTPHRMRAGAFSPDGRWILTAGEDKSARVWNASNGAPQLTLAGHTLGIFSADYSPDGKRIVTGSQDLFAKVWDAATGQQLLALSEHKGMVSSVAFSPDGQRLVTGSLDGTALVWTAALPEQVAIWQQEEQLRASNRPDAAPPLPALAAASTHPSLLPPGLITRWLLLAPIGVPTSDPAAALAQEQIPNEANLQPRTRERIQFAGRDLTWEPLKQCSTLLDFNVVVGQASSRDSVAYAVSYLVTEAPQSGVIFHITGDDEFKVYLNGRDLHRSNPDRSYVLDEEKVAGVELSGGTNTLVFKILNHSERWLGSVRVLDAKGQPLTDLRTTLEPGARW